MENQVSYPNIYLEGQRNEDFPKDVSFSVIDCNKAITRPFDIRHIIRK